MTGNKKTQDARALKGRRLSYDNKMSDQSIYSAATSHGVFDE
jgi:hypothetical protein